MWRRNGLIIAIGFTLAVQSKLSGDETSSPDLLLSDLNWVHFDVAMGRIMATTIRTKQDRQRAHRELPSGVTESLAASIDRGLISLQYSLDSDSRQLAVHVVRRDDIEIRWTRRGSHDQPLTIVYSQSPGNAVSLSVFQGELPARVYRARSLWHLAMIHPDQCEQHLAGVLGLVLPDWRFLDEAGQIRSALFLTTPGAAATSLAEVRVLVAQLAHKDFRLRQRADRELQSRGQYLLCLLDELDPQELDAEQRLRIKEIRRAITGDASDTPLRVANWLVNDKQVWLALMVDGDLQRRLAAGRQLARICEETVDFDPHAEPQVRAEQIAAIRTQLRRR